MSTSGGPRVALVHGRATPEHDGVADYVGRLATALADEGLDVVAVPVRESGPGGVLDAARRIRAARPEVVHVQFAPSAFGFSPLPGLLPLLVGSHAPVVTTLHEYGWWAAPSWMPEVLWRTLERRRLWDRETGRLVPASAAALTTNPAHGAVLGARVGVRAVRVPLAPNAPDLGAGAPRADVRRRLGVRSDAVLAVFFGFVHPVKGLRYLIEAVSALHEEYPGLHLLVVGGFTSLALPEPQALAFRDELVTWARGCGVEDAVTFTGHLPAEAVSAALHAADVAVFPFTAGASTKSGALLSAFAHRLPTVVTAAEEPDPDLVDGETVVVAPRRRDAAALAVALRRVLGDDALRRKVAEGGAALAAERTWSRVAAAHRDLYAEVLRV